MAFRYRLEILTLITVVAFCIIFLYANSTIQGAKFAGSDTIGSAQIAVMTGTSENEFHPLVWQWNPPSGEVEAGLFALQAAIGGIIVGWVFGYWKGQKKKKSSS